MDRKGLSMRDSLMCPSRGPNPHDIDTETRLQGEVLTLLEAAGMPTDINDQIAALIAEGEARIAKGEPRHD